MIYSLSTDIGDFHLEQDINDILEDGLGSYIPFAGDRKNEWDYRTKVPNAKEMKVDRERTRCRKILEDAASWLISMNL